MVDISAEKPYKIYEYLDQDHGIFDEYLAPHHLDFVTGINIRLHPKRTFVLGEMTEVIYYESFDGQNYSIPVVRETFVYTRDPVSKLAISRIQTIEWYDVDGNLGEFPKIRGPKYYNTMTEKIKESKIKKGNQVNTAGEVCIGSLIQLSGKTLAEATSLGQAYWNTLIDSGMIPKYIDGLTQPLRDQITADTLAGDPDWLNNTIRDLILAELL